jgi:uncharacterized membrane protein YedE/YeeE
MDELEGSTIMGIGGFVVGLLFGALTHRTNFCTMGSISDAVSFEDFRRARAWLLAIAISIAGAHALQYAELIDLTQSIYLGSSLNWLGGILGGLIFGFGMVIASGCPGRNLARVGGGDLKALVVLLFIGLFGYMALRGLTAPVRSFIQTGTMFDLTAVAISDQQLGTVISDLSGLPKKAAQAGSAAIVVVALLFFCFKNTDFRSSPSHIVAGLGIGLLVTAGWWITGVVGGDEFEPAQLASLTFVAPSGNGLQYLMTFTGATINFGIATVGGAILGAFLSATAGRQFFLSSFYDKKDTVHHMLGGAMMGTGGVLALGCTIGQGITGISTLSIGSAIALVSIVTGGYAGIKYMERAIGL